MPAHAVRSASRAFREPLTFALAVLFVVAIVSEVLPASGSDSTWPFRALAFTFATLVLAFDLWRPVVPAWLVGLSVAIPAGWLNVVDVGSTSMLFVVGVVGWLAYSRSLRSALIGSGIAVSAVVSYLPDRDTSGMVGVIVVSVATFAVALFFVRQQRLLEQLKQTQRELALQAAAEERRRIAAEIHDIVAHSLAVTLLQLTGARMLIKRTGGDIRALDALAEAERIGRESMTNLRRVVGLLRDPGAGRAAALPGTRGLHELVDEYRLAGLPLALDVSGDLDRVESAVVLALYRICQEALANVVKHAGRSPTHVAVAVDEAVDIQIENDLPAGYQSAGVDNQPTLGIPGMRERAELLGGQVTAGTVNGRWVVHAHFPLMRAAAPTVSISAPGR